MDIKEKLSNKFGLEKILEDGNSLKKVMAWYPNKKLYKNNSAYSGKEIISVYPPNTDCKIYKHEEWYRDDWNPAELDVSLETPFFEQFKQLLHSSPVVTLLSNLQQNSEYCHDVEGMKDCYYCFDGINSQNSFYCCRIHYCVSCVDCYSIYNSELLYECVNMEESYSTQYSYHCKQVSNSFFLFNCRNVQNSFMCSNLRNKSYCIYNKQYTKEEYEAFIEKIDFSDYKQILDLKKHFYDDVVSKAAMPSSFQENCENSQGNYLKNSSDVEKVFESWDMKDAYNCFQCSKGKDVMNSYMCCENVEQCFQSVATGIGVYNVRNCAYNWHSSNMEYCYLCLNCKDCFGCVGLRKKQYCILNKQYTKEVYLAKKEELIEHMNNTGEYGQFFPMEMSPFKYEDTIAFDLFDEQYTDVFNLEYNLYNDQSTLDSSQTQKCLITNNIFGITAQELEFYKQHSVPIPKVSFPIRYKGRMEIMDTSFVEQNIGKLKTTFKHPEKRNIVSDELYEGSLK